MHVPGEWRLTVLKLGVVVTYFLTGDCVPHDSTYPLDSIHAGKYSHSNNSFCCSSEMCWCTRFLYSKNELQLVPPGFQNTDAFARRQYDMRSLICCVSFLSSSSNDLYISTVIPSRCRWTPCRRKSQQTQTLWVLSSEVSSKRHSDMLRKRRLSVAFHIERSIANRLGLSEYPCACRRYRGARVLKVDSVTRHHRIYCRDNFLPHPILVCSSTTHIFVCLLPSPAICLNNCIESIIHSPLILYVHLYQHICPELYVLQYYGLMSITF